jgi:tetratricopeptide (TPR) repeat protein
VEQEIDLRFSIRSALFPLGRHEELGEWVRGAQSLAQEIGDNIRLSHALNYLSNLHWIHGEYRKAIEIAKKAMNLAEKAEDFSGQVATLYHLGVYFCSLGDYSQQVEVCGKVRKLLTGKKALQRHGMVGFPAAISCSLLALGMAELGKFEGIEEIAREALDLVQKVGNAFTVTAVNNFLALAYLRQGKVRRALQLLDEGYKQSRQYQVKAAYSFTLALLGHAHILSNELGRALSVLEEAAKGENLEASQRWEVHLFTVLADTYRAIGKIELAKETISRALEIAGSREEKGMEAWAMLVQAGIHVDKGRLEEAMKWYQQGLRQASDLSMRPVVAHFHKGIGSVYQRLELDKEAQAEIETAQEMYRSMGMMHWLES